jgi:hypothetical protein
MDMHLMSILLLVTSILSGVILIVALFALWNRSQSTWVLLALLGAGVSLLLRLAFAVAPTILSITPMMPLVWPITGLLVSAGLLGYALDESKRRS